MKHIFIINPAAGKKDSRQRVYTMAEALKKNHDLDIECMLTKSRGHAMMLTVRYKFNATRNKYKGSGAGESEKERL